MTTELSEDPSEDLFRTTTLKERPDLAERVFEVMTDTWPAFILHDEVGADHWLELYVRFPEYQVVVTDARGSEVFGVGNSLPLYFAGALHELPQAGWSWAILKGIEDSDEGVAPNYQCALAATVPAHHQGKALSARVLKAMKAVGARRGLNGLIAPVRPSQKHLHPLVEFADYCGWTNEKGECFDLWLRTHQRLGAKVLAPCMESVSVSGSRRDWLEWAGLDFTTSGDHCVPRALVPVRYDAERDLGRYVEPNLWMVHPFGGTE